MVSPIYLFSVQIVRPVMRITMGYPNPRAFLFGSSFISYMYTILIRRLNLLVFSFARIFFTLAILRRIRVSLTLIWSMYFGVNLYGAIEGHLPLAQIPFLQLIVFESHSVHYLLVRSNLTSSSLGTGHPNVNKELIVFLVYGIVLYWRIKSKSQSIPLVVPKCFNVKPPLLLNPNKRWIRRTVWCSLH